MLEKEILLQLQGAISSKDWVQFKASLDRATYQLRRASCQRGTEPQWDSQVKKLVETVPSWPLSDEFYCSYRSVLCELIYLERNEYVKVAWPGSPLQPKLLQALEHLASISDGQLLLAVAKTIPTISDGRVAIQFLDWLDKSPPTSVSRLPHVGKDRITAARILRTEFNENAPDDIAALLGFLKHQDSYVRAAAALRLGWLCRSKRIDAALRSEIVDAVMRTHKKAPDVAGPFISGYGRNAKMWSDQLGIDLHEWTLEALLTQDREVPDPLPIACGLSFEAHEMLAGNVEAVAQMLDSGLEWTAFLTASELQYPVDGMAPLLVRMAELPDVEVAYRASWVLAHVYRQVHAKAAENGWVLREAIPEAELFWLRGPDDIGPTRLWAWSWQDTGFVDSDIDDLVSVLFPRDCVDVKSYSSVKPGSAHWRNYGTFAVFPQRLRDSVEDGFRNICFVTRGKSNWLEYPVIKEVARKMVAS